MKRLIVATDFSESAEVAVEQAAVLASTLDADLVIAHAANVSGAEPDFFERITGRLEEFRRELRADLLRRRERLEHLDARIAEQSGVRTTHRLLDGFPDEQLAKAAGEVGADLLIVGTRRGVGPILLGSVAERVVRASTRPVLVARPPVSRPGFAKILVGTDFEDASRRALELAVELAAPGAQVHVLHVGEDEMAERAGDNLVDRWRGKLDISFHTRHGHAAQHILEQLDDTPRYDLVALGTHGRRGWRRWWLGSIAEATLRYAACSVLVVPPDDA